MFADDGVHDELVVVPSPVPEEDWNGCELAVGCALEAASLVRPSYKFTAEVIMVADGGSVQRFGFIDREGTKRLIFLDDGVVQRLSALPSPPKPSPGLVV